MYKTHTGGDVEGGDEVEAGHTSGEASLTLCLMYTYNNKASHIIDAYRGGC